jgi:hypothetical protein
VVDLDEYTNTLFDSKASPSTSSSPPPQATATSSGGGEVVRRGQDRGRESAKARGRGGGRARSVSVAPHRFHSVSMDAYVRRRKRRGGRWEGSSCRRARLAGDEWERKDGSKL